MTDDAAAAAVIEAARHLVFRERWRMELPDDREIPDRLAAALERTLAALDAAKPEGQE
ncbi:MULTISPECIES: hypothetical protein [unclassified Methylobacterium]|uniref:hypothetical protein n=1 Tax=unclassified Methylobacterium TaxID=2615210 RepID=UPI0008E21FE2|nr:MULTISPECIES: hypothetical protein [unclassified Methylobacterium]SFU50542.1 hypothetical protein SAMN02799643_00959 [Methylobacterium sp. UNCCL125]